MPGLLVERERERERDKNGVDLTSFLDPFPTKLALSETILSCQQLTPIFVHVNHHYEEASKQSYAEIMLIDYIQYTLKYHPYLYCQSQVKRVDELSHTVSTSCLMICR